MSPCSLITNWKFVSFCLIASLRWDESCHLGHSFPSVTLMDILHLESGVSHCSPISQNSCILLISVKQLHIYLTHIWTVSKPWRRMSWKGRSVASGDFVLCPLASVPAADWILKTTSKKTESLSIHRVWDDIIALLLHNKRRAIKIAFIYWILSMGQALWISAWQTPIHNNPMM